MFCEMIYTKGSADSLAQSKGSSCLLASSLPIQYIKISSSVVEIPAGPLQVVRFQGYVTITMSIVSRNSHWLK